MADVLTFKTREEMESFVDDFVPEPSLLLLELCTEKYSFLRGAEHFYNMFAPGNRYMSTRCPNACIVFNTDMPELVEWIEDLIKGVEKNRQIEANPIFFTVLGKHPKNFREMDKKVSFLESIKTDLTGRIKLADGRIVNNSIYADLPFSERVKTRMGFLASTVASYVGGDFSYTRGFNNREIEQFKQLAEGRL